MISLYRQGTSVVHRMPPAAKLGVLAASALLLSLAPLDGWGIASVGLAVIGLYLLAGFGWHTLAAECWRLRWIIVVLGGMLTLFISPLHAWVHTGRVVVLLLMAGLLTLTTRMGDLLQVLHRVLRPLGRVGVDADAVAMTLSMTMTMIPVIAGFADRVREAQQARGVRLGVRQFVPLLVLTMRHADDVGDALIARGLS